MEKTLYTLQDKTVMENEYHCFYEDPQFLDDLRLKHEYHKLESETALALINARARAIEPSYTRRHKKGQRSYANLMRKLGALSP